MTPETCVLKTPESPPGVNSREGPGEISALHQERLFQGKSSAVYLSPNSNSGKAEARNDEFIFGAETHNRISAFPSRKNPEILFAVSSFCTLSRQENARTARSLLRSQSLFSRPSIENMRNEETDSSGFSLSLLFFFSSEQKGKREKERSANWVSRANEASFYSLSSEKSRFEDGKGRPNFVVLTVRVYIFKMRSLRFERSLVSLIGERACRMERRILAVSVSSKLF